MQNILLLGADPATVSLYRNHFERAGVSLASAEIVEPLGDFLRLAQPAAVLLDVTQTNSDGEDLLRGIRAEPEFRDLLLFALTEPPPAGSGKAAKGATKSFQKVPAIVPDVVKAVTAALKGSSESETSAPPQMAPPVSRVEEKSATEKAVSLPTPSASSGMVKQLTESFRLFSAAGDGERGGLLLQMQEQVRSLRRSFLSSDSTVLAAFTSALTRLVITLSKDLGRVNSSSLRTLSLAVDVLNQSLQSASPESSVESGPVRVLVLDDDALSRRAVQFALGCPDLELADCESIKRALDCLRADQFDLVFTDARMLRAGDFTTQLRQLPNGADIPIIIVTALADFDARVQSGPSGGFDWIAKPFTPSEMVVKAFTFALKRRLGQGDDSERPVPVAAQPVIAFTPCDDSAETVKPGIKNGAGSSATHSPEPLPPSIQLPADSLAVLSAPRESADATAKIEELQNKLRQLEKELAAKDARIASDQSERNLEMGRLEALTEKQEQTEQRFQEQKQQLVELAAAKELSDAAAREAARWKELEPQLRNEVESRQATEARTHALEQRAINLESRLAQERAECERLRLENNVMRNTEETLKNQVKDREGAATELRESLARSAAQFDQESGRRSAAEEQVKALGERQKAREQEFSERARLEEQSRSALSAEAERLKTQLDHTAAENSELHAKLNGLSAAQNGAAGQLPAPTGGSLQQKIDEMTAYDLVTGELNRVRNQLVEERSQRQKFQTDVSELEDLKEELTRKLETLSQSERARQQATESLEAKLQETLAKLGTVESSLQAQARECRRLQQRAKELEEQVNDLSSQLTTQAVIEQSRRRREAELEACVVEQQAQIANTKAALAGEGAAMQRTRERIHFALCRVIQELNTDKASLASSASLVQTENSPAEEPAHAA